MSINGRPRDAMRATLALALLAAFFAALLALFRWKVPPENVDLVNFMLGQLSILTAGAVGYYMNTSKSSSDKNAMLSERPTGNPGDPVHVEDEVEYPSPKFGET